MNRLAFILPLALLAVILAAAAQLPPLPPPAPLLPAVPARTWRPATNQIVRLTLEWDYPLQTEIVSSPTLDGTNWTHVAYVPIPTMSFTITNPAAAQQFYRVRTVNTNEP